MKIVHLLNTGAYSGAENVVITIINNMKRYYNYEFVYVSLNGIISEILKENDIIYYPLTKLTISSVNKMLNDLKPDILHCHDFTASIIGSYANTSKIPIISHLHNNPYWIKSKNIKTLIYKMTLKKYSYVLAVSDSVFSEFVYSNKIANKMVISNPIDINSIRKTAKKEAIDQFYYDIVFLGRLDDQKDPLRFIRIIDLLNKEIDGLKAVMVGDGVLKSECIKLVNEKTIKNINIVGFQKQRFKFLMNSKILCITSKWEGFGLMAVEGLALSKPVISTGVGGLKNIVTNKCGKICFTDNEFIIEIKKLLLDVHYYKEKSNMAASRAEQLNNINEYIENINSIYLDII